MKSVKPDTTMRYYPGSLVFSVEGVLFRIPKALLQQHSEGFSNMLDRSGSEEEPIVLADSLRVFRDWVATLFTPRQSCLSPPHPALSNLERLLELLMFCQKYVVTDLETYLLSVVTPMTHADVLASHLTKTLTKYRIVEIADILGQPEIAATARAMILEELWSDEPKDAYEALRFGEQVGDKEIIGAAYYQVLISRSLPWAHDNRLTELHHRHLEFGRNQCAEEWREIFDEWGNMAQIPDGYRRGYLEFQSYWLLPIWKEIAEGAYASCDVVGRLRAARRCAERYGSNTRSAMIQKKQEEVQDSMYHRFVPHVGAR